MAGRGESRKNRVAGSTHPLPKNTKALGSLTSYPDTSQAKETKRAMCPALPEVICRSCQRSTGESREISTLQFF